MTKMMTPKSLLEINLLDFWQRVHADLIRDTVDNFGHWYLSSRKPDGLTAINWQHQQLCRFVAHEITETHQSIESLHKRYSSFAVQVQRSATEQEEWQHQSEFLRYLGYSRKQVKKDAAAKKRWFGNDAIKDRYQNRIAKQENKICFFLQRLGHLMHLYGQEYSSRETEILLKALDLQSQLAPLLRYEGNERLTFEAMACLRVAFDHLSIDILETLSPAIAQHAYRTASDPYQPVWLQSEAVAVLFTLEEDTVAPLLLHRLESPPRQPDDFFFRARAVQTLFHYMQKVEGKNLESLVLLVLKDNSVHVRQQLAERIDLLPNPLMASVFQAIVQQDDSAQVRGKAWLNLPSILSAANEQDTLLDRYCTALEQESEVLLLRLLMELAPELYVLVSNEPQRFYRRCRDLLTNINSTHELTAARRWAALVREQLWQLSRKQLDADSQQKLLNMDLSQTTKIKRPALSDSILGRYLAAIGQKGFGFDVQAKQGRLRIRGGYKSGFRLWRFLHEWRNPATDKRQNYNHAKGRIFYGNLQTPSPLLAETSQTKVPGEPLLMDGEQGWRPYLPLVDQVLSSLDQGWPTQPVKLYTSEGVTEIMPPRNIAARLWAKFQIVRQFKKIAELRNWREKSEKPPTAYLQTLVGLGFTFRFLGHEEEDKPLPVDPRVARFFPALVPFYSLGELWREIQNYFYSVYQNSIQQLSVFLVLIAGLFFGQHFWLNFRFRQARQSIPYVIGGWGTRGKSGTERLKAALFNAAGVSMVSKSSGCEAQFLYAPVQRPLKELFLFRPYDKASIWEQMNITRLAARLDVDLFLWECMGLTPRYIDILQQQWMRDDLSTITNCYPDHEDIQGPAGIDIPKVMMRFVPRNATLISSEDSMSPLLESAARKQNTDFIQVTWRDGYLLAPDVLKRFPYEEHPTNIALVLKLSDVLGFPADLALKSMADYVVPDLGVLKIYPESQLYGRRFIFINGMSANERFASLNNWRRLELDKITPDSDPDIWLTSVVNNRADRIARSQVFAKMLVNDLSADTHFLIGTNLDGLQNYIEEAWQERLEELPWDAKSKEEREQLHRYFVELCQYIRVVTEDELVQKRIQSMLAGLGVTEGEHVGVYWQTPGALEAALKDIAAEDREGIIRFMERAQQEIAAYQDCCQRILDAGHTIDAESLREQLWRWYQQRFVVIEDVHASGNAVIFNMVENTPPGLCNKMMGLQNIKGTGLDFIYRWQAWDKAYKLCQQLGSRSTQEAGEAAKALANINDFGLLDESLVTRSCQAVRDKKLAQTELFQAELNVIEANLAGQLAKIKKRLNISADQSTVLDTLLGYVEAFLDPGNAVKRRRIANRIYDDLAEQRISIERAVFELQGLNKEQKGGWLRQRLGRS